MSEEASRKAARQATGRTTDELLSPKQVQTEYGFSPQTLANWRWMGLGPSYVKTTPGRSGRIKYRRSVIEKYLDAMTVKTGGAAA